MARYNRPGVKQDDMPKKDSIARRRHRGADGNAACPDAGADFRDLAVDPNAATPPGIGLDAEGPLAATDGVSSRFIGPDRAQPLPCYVDIDVLPNGITPPQAAGAVSKPSPS